MSGTKRISQVFDLSMAVEGARTWIMTGSCASIELCVECSAELISDGSMGAPVGFSCIAIVLGFSIWGGVETVQAIASVLIAM